MEERINKWGDRPMFAVCSASGRWFWAAWESNGKWFDGAEPLGSGYAPDKTTAENQARSLLGPGAEAGRAYHATHYLRQLACERRAKRPGNGNSADEVELVYQERLFDETPSYTPHRVVKKTARYVFIDKEPYNNPFGRGASGDWRDYDISTVRIDRVKLEHDGEAKAPGLPGWWQGHFYLKPPHRQASSRNAPITPHCISALGLSLPCTITDARRAYRQKSKELHPDAGGNDAEFIRLKEAYDEALRYLQERERKAN